MPKPQLTYCHKKCATLSVKVTHLSVQLKLGLCNKCHIFFVNCTQFEIVGCSYQYGDCGKHLDNTEWGCMINGKPIYKRLFIKRVS